MAFISPSERSRKRWDHLSADPPLMGFECRPPAGIPPTCPLPGTEAPFGPTPPSADSRSALVVSHHHDGFLHAEVAGLLHPATCQGFAAFRACRFPAPPEGGAARRSALPATRFTPFEEFPSPAAVLHHCSRCLPAVTVLPGAGPDRGRCRCRSPRAEARDVHPLFPAVAGRAILLRRAGGPVPSRPAPKSRGSGGPPWVLPDETRRPMRRSAPFAVPVEAKRATPRRVPFAMPRGWGTR
jgi:hypothetical protein